jgi:hypothetical protein
MLHSGVTCTGRCHSFAWLKGFSACAAPPLPLYGTSHSPLSRVLMGFKAGHVGMRLWNPPATTPLPLPGERGYQGRVTCAHVSGDPYKSRSPPSPVLKCLRTGSRVYVPVPHALISTFHTLVHVTKPLL